MKGIIRVSNLTKELINSANQLIFSTKVRHYSSGTWDANLYLCKPMILDGKSGWVISAIRDYDGYTMINDGNLGKLVPVSFELFTTDGVLEWLNDYWDYEMKSRLSEGFVEFELREGYGYDPTRHVVNVVERYPEAFEYPGGEYNRFEDLQLHRYCTVYNEDHFSWEN